MVTGGKLLPEFRHLLALCTHMEPYKRNTNITYIIYYRHIIIGCRDLSMIDVSCICII